MTVEMCFRHGCLEREMMLSTRSQCDELELGLSLNEPSTDFVAVVSI